MGKGTIIEAQNSNTEFENTKSKGILGKLKGIFADYKNGTRNSDRLYSEELWDNRVFGSEDVMEALQTKTLFGELDHPEGDRCETLAKNAAISITKLEKRPEEGVIYGEAEILDTPTGRIVKALADSGAKLGISSRGMGEEIFSEGRNIIDPDTYDFITFDVVVTPANTKARVALTESKHSNKLTESLKKEIEESETENQLDQINTVLKNVYNNKELEDLSQDKRCEIKKSKNKISEANKNIIMNVLQKRLSESELKIKSEKKSAEINKKLLSRLSEKVIKYKKELQESNLSRDEALTDNEKNESKVAELMKENNSLNDKNQKLIRENKNLASSMKSIQDQILQENKKLKAKVEELSDKKAKIEENKSIQSKRILELEDKVRQLSNSTLRLEESNKRLSKLPFSSIESVQVDPTLFNNTNMSSEDIDLYNALINR